MVSHEPPAVAGSSAWRAWLDQSGQATFKYASPDGHFTGRRESKARADQSYWYAYRKIGGRLRKAYLGRSEDLTAERLEAIAAQLGDAPARSKPSASDEEPAPAPLPLVPTVLIGRDRDLATLADILLKGARLLTLTGPGGTGKTRLAIAVAQRIAERFDHGAHFVDLSNVVDPNLVIREIAHSLNIHEVGNESIDERLHSYLAPRRALLVLDNMEQVVEAAAALSALLDGCPRLTLLVTSREPLHLVAERQYAVPPLERSPSIDLFVSRAAATGATLQLTDQVSRDIAELCVQLDGLPLAIELAAARARMMMPRDMLARLGRRTELLKSRENDRALRHQSVRAVVAWSCDLLSPRERHAFVRLSVFAGGCSLDAAESVLEDSDALDLIAALIDKSLVVSLPGPTGESRLRMLETIRAYGLELLADESHEQSIRLAHARYFLSFLRPPNWEALDLPSEEWLARAGAEHDNVRGAVRWTLQHQHFDLALELAVAFQGFWMLRGYLAEGLEFLEQTVVHADAAGVESIVAALAFHAAGQIAWRRGEYTRAEQNYSAGLAIRRRIGNPLGVAVALQGLASVARDRGDVHEAIVLWEQCVSVFKEAGNRVRFVRSTVNLAITLHLAGQSERAATLLSECVELARQVNQPWARATALTYLGLIANEVWHDSARAAAYTYDALQVAPRVADAWVTAHALELAAWLASGPDATGETSSALLAAGDALRTRMAAHLHPAFVDGHERLIEWLQLLDVEPVPADQALAPPQALQLAIQTLRRTPRPTPSRRALQVAATDSPLSRREREVAELVARGLTSREIAEQLTLGERTVETHVDHIRAKLGVRSRAQIAAWLVTQKP